jgi:hypothetical protein
MLHVFKRKSDSATIITIDANQPPGHFDDDEAPIGIVVHDVLDGVQVEITENPPVPVVGRRQIELDMPTMLAADRTICLDMRKGVYGIPVIWSTSYIAGVGKDAVIVSVESEPLPGELKFHVRMVVQPL